MLRAATFDGRLRSCLAAALAALVLLAPLSAGAQTYGRDYIIVTPGMTLTRIMREYYPQHRPHWPAIMDYIIERNPHAFVNNAPASLKRGMRLRLPQQIPPPRTGAGTAARQGVTTTRQQTQQPAPEPAQSSSTPSAAAPAPRVALPQAPVSTGSSSAARTDTSTQQPVAALPPQTPEPAPAAAAAQPPASGDGDGGERPPWWWIISAVVMAALIL